MSFPISVDYHRPIGFGSTSSLFSCSIFGLTTNGAFKVTKSSPNSILKETQILKLLSGSEGFPQLHAWECGKDQSWIAMERLGVSVKKIISLQRQMQVQEVVHLGLQMLDRIQKLHEIGYLHIDLKPQHFLFGEGEKKNTLHLIDFGMSQKMINQENAVPRRKTIFFKGNLSYSSVSRMKGYEACATDDLQSLVYIIAELLEGCLPWSKFSKQNSLSRKFVLLLKMKERQQGWNKYGWWVRSTLKILKSSEDPYYDLRKSVFRLLQN